MVQILIRGKILWQFRGVEKEAILSILSLKKDPERYEES
jgi:hypothetical protein